MVLMVMPFRYFRSDFDFFQEDTQFSCPPGICRMIFFMPSMQLQSEFLGRNAIAG